MSRFFGIVLLTAMTAMGSEVVSPPTSSDQSSRVTFDKDVLPIVQKNCQTCHRPGGIAPMSFLTYELVLPDYPIARPLLNLTAHNSQHI
jgi:hypothetical protein